MDECLINKYNNHNIPSLAGWSVVSGHCLATRVDAVNDASPPRSPAAPAASVVGSPMSANVHCLHPIVVDLF